MYIHLFSFFAALTLIVLPMQTNAQTMPAHYPSHTSGSTSFDWQAEWGSIHLNSAADGLGDPGTQVSGGGIVPCEGGNVCNKTGIRSKASIAIQNGIKFDIKNSFVNCMSTPMLNWAENNIWDPDDTVCKTEYGLKPLRDQGKTRDGHKPIYAPIYDARANDDRNWQSHGAVGCQQQMVNQCARGMHECIGSSDGPGYLHPVSHIFTAEEAAQLGGSQVPAKYYAYQKKSGPAGKVYLSPSDPTGGADTKPGTVQEISTHSPELARLKSYKFTNTDPNEDRQSFILMDPSDFYDLRHYVAGGKYDSGYKQFDGSGLVQTYDTCPVLGLTGGYSGICDPTGKAGCNLPIYGVGAETTFTDASGQQFKYNAYPVKWSGYVKQWAIISATQYYDNIKDRKTPTGANLYLTGSAINDNPVIQITRADDYCDPRERTSKPGTGMAPDMPCIQYLQYQAIDTTGTKYFFVDLFSPGEEPEGATLAEHDTMFLYDVKQDGFPDMSKPVPGSGTDIYIGGSGTRTGYVSFKDFNNPLSVYNDASRGIAGAKAVVKADYKNNPVYNSRGLAAPGQYLSPDQNPAKGVGIASQSGTSAIIRMGGNEENHVSIGTPTSCVVVNNTAPEREKVFVPTNTKEEFQAFVDAGSSGKIQNINVRKCNVGYQAGAEAAAKTGSVAVTGSQTWTGMVSCNSLTSRPACNQTKVISAQRYCQVENGSFDKCSVCSKAQVKGELIDPDSGMVFSNESASGEVMVNPSTSSGKCYFSAACFATSSSGGCPQAGTGGGSGGHVFCLSADTKITMANGKTKNISKIKAGEMVKSFDAKLSRSVALGAARVKATAITKQQEIIKINNLRITPLHKIILASGRAVMAKDIQIGDLIMLEDGNVQAVENIENGLKPITVYNLVLEDGADGYIANGMRVLSYPDMKGMTSLAAQ